MPGIAGSRGSSSSTKDCYALKSKGFTKYPSGCTAAQGVSSAAIFAPVSITTGSMASAGVVRSVWRTFQPPSLGSPMSQMVRWGRGTPADNPCCCRKARAASPSRAVCIRYGRGPYSRNAVRSRLTSAGLSAARSMSLC
jgi:hypothetical protein